MFQALFVHEGKHIDYTPSSAVAAGQVVVQNSLVGIAKTPIAANALGALAVSGVFDVAKATGAINAGAGIYWDADGDPVGGTAGTGAATTTSTNNSFMGFALLDAASGDKTVRLVLIPVTGVTNTIHQDLTNVIADPGTGQAIDVTDSGHVSLVTAGAETRSLPDPVNPGQLLSLVLKTAGGECVITAASALNQTGNNTLTFDSDGQSIALHAVEVGANLAWRVLANDGVNLSTV